MDVSGCFEKVEESDGVMVLDCLSSEQGGLFNFVDELLRNKGFRLVEEKRGVWGYRRILDFFSVPIKLWLLNDDVLMIIEPASIGKRVISALTEAGLSVVGNRFGIKSRDRIDVAIIANVSLVSDVQKDIRNNLIEIANL